jgi:hypothetical protein
MRADWADVPEVWRLMLTDRDYLAEGWRPKRTDWADVPEVWRLMLTDPDSLAEGRWADAC